MCIIPEWLYVNLISLWGNSVMPLALFTRKREKNINYDFKNPQKWCLERCFEVLFFSWWTKKKKYYEIQNHISKPKKSKIMFLCIVFVFVFVISKTISQVLIKWCPKPCFKVLFFVFVFVPAPSLSCYAVVASVSSHYHLHHCHHHYHRHRQHHCHHPWSLV